MLSYRQLHTREGRKWYKKGEAVSDKVNSIYKDKGFDVLVKEIYSKILKRYRK